MENKTYMITEMKKARSWKVIWETDNEARVHEELMRDLVAKKLHECTYIKSIKETTDYTGYRTITVTYDNDTRRRYRIRW